MEVKAAEFERTYSAQDCQWVITVTKGAMVTPIIALHHTRSKNLYNKGLQKDFKDLVDMDTMSDGMVYLLNTILKCGNLNEVVYNHFLSTYSSFIDKEKDYEDVQAALKQEVW